MLKIWGRKDSPNVEKVLWCAYELKLQHERINAGHGYGLVDEPWYREMNPNGLIPTINDDGYVLWESNTIVKYLCAKHSPADLSPTDISEFYDADRWICWHSSTLGVAMRQVVMQVVRVPKEQRDPKLTHEIIEAAAKLWAIVDHRLSTRDFLMGQRFSMVDIVFGPHTHRWFTYPLARPELPNLAAWYARLRERDAYLKAIS